MESLAYEMAKAGAERARKAADDVMAAQPGASLLRGRRHRADDENLLHFHRCQRCRGARHNLRRSRCRLLRAGPRLAGRRRGHSAGRDDFRHFERESRFLCDPETFRRTRTVSLPCLQSPKSESESKSAICNRPSAGPIMASVTFIQAGSNRGVTGQTVEAFWNSISHVPLLSAWA